MNITQYKFFQLLTQQPCIDEIWLYGSRSRGDFTEKSDIDLAIIAPHATPDNWQNILTIIHEADTLLKIDCVHFDKLTDNEFKKNIIKDKVILFKKNMTQQEKINQKILILEEAVTRLDEAIKQGSDNHRLYIDASIQRFEFSFELFWKTIKYILKEQGIETQYPKDTLKMAFQSKLIVKEQEYIAMLNDRNETSHTYDVHIADRIYENIKNLYTELLTTDTLHLKKQFYKQ